MIAGCSSNGFPGPQVGFCGVEGLEGFKQTCNMWPKGASVCPYLPPESLQEFLCRRVRGPQKVDGGDREDSLVKKEVYLSVVLLVWFQFSQM